MPANGPLALLRTRRFLPLLVTQTLGALNDNLVKNALVILALFKTAEGAGMGFTALAGGIFILPFFLASATAGQLADRHDKAGLIRVTKLFELCLMALAGLGFWTESLPLLLGVLFGLGLQSALFGPLKYGILPDHLAERELVAGNGLIEAGTFGGILIGTIAGGALILLEDGTAIVSILGLLLSATGLLAAWAIPPAPAAAPDLSVGWNPARETVRLLRQARGNRPVWMSILALSWFWTVGATLLAVFPVLAQQVLGAGGMLVTAMLTVFALGVGIGSIACARLLNGDVSPRLVPFAALGISIFTLDFALASNAAGAAGLGSLDALIAAPQGWRMFGDLALLAACGGVFSVPLYAILQEYSPRAERSRMIAANNVANAGFMVAGAGVTAAFSALGLSAAAILVIAAALNLAVAAWIVRTIPQETAKALFRAWFRLFHRARLRGIENYLAAGDRAVIVANHLSFLDGCLIAALLPDRPTFAVNLHVARKWWAKPLLALVDTFEVDPTSPYALKAMVRAVQSGRKLVVFPEGRITRTGALMKIYEGAAVVADKTGAQIVPLRLEGPQYTPLSRMRGKLRLRWFPRMTVTILPPVTLRAEEGLSARARRRTLGEALDAVMTDAAFAAADPDRSVFAALLDARGRHGGKAEVLEDIERRPLTYDRLVLGAAVLGRKLAELSVPGERLGVMLPNANGTVVSFAALQAFGRVPAMLNFSAGAESMLSACRAAEIRIVLTSRRFVEKAKLSEVVERMSGQLRFVWLEDVRQGITLRDKLRGMLDSRFARRLPGARVAVDAPAVVLFTSGSEGAPKGVALSHRNLVANCAQLEAALDFNPADRVVNAMPLFHSFGLTGGTLLPLLNGVPVFLYPSPLHYRIVPEVVYDAGASILFGTDTFLNGWARFAHQYDFHSVRLIFSGAEKLREETRRLFADRFGKGILEGYGATETSPALAINTPKRARAGTVGRLLPGIEHRLDPVPGVAEGGRLVVRGPNVMLGYYKTSAPGVLEAPEGGWYDTGDIVAMEAEGFLRILGRAKRFAKIAGEMVSMPAAEALAAGLWPDAMHAVVALPDQRKGERLVLVTTQPGAEPRMLLAHARERGVAEIMVPREVRVVDRMPQLGTGKTDYPAVERLAATTVALA